jgi:alpha-L-arabinofuranosidase
MFSNHVGDQILDSNLTGGGRRLFYSVTRDSRNGTVILKLVNASSISQPLDIKLAGARGVASDARLISLTGATPDETNTISEPTRIVHVETELKNAGSRFRHTLPPYSIEVMELNSSR